QHDGGDGEAEVDREAVLGQRVEHRSPRVEKRVLAKTQRRKGRGEESFLVFLCGLCAFARTLFFKPSSTPPSGPPATPPGHTSPRTPAAPRCAATVCTSRSDPSATSSRS